MAEEELLAEESADILLVEREAQVRLARPLLRPVAAHRLHNRRPGAAAEERRAHGAADDAPAAACFAVTRLGAFAAPPAWPAWGGEDVDLMKEVA